MIGRLSSSSASANSLLGTTTGRRPSSRISFLSINEEATPLIPKKKLLKSKSGQMNDPEDRNGLLKQYYSFDDPRQLLSDDREDSWNSLSEAVSKSKAQSSGIPDLGDGLEEDRPDWKLRIKLIVPHVALVAITISYIVLGALVFQYLERQHFENIIANYSRRLNTDKEQLLSDLWKISRDKSVSFEDFSKASEKDYSDYVDTVYATVKMRHIASKIRLKMEMDNSTFEPWDFVSSVFFTATMVTTIGYGFITPLTFYGRLFCITYSLIGIPLALVTVADVAKFVSEFLFFIHFNYMQFKLKLKDKFAKEEERDLSNVKDFELDKVTLIHFPPSLVFSLIFIYCFIGAFCLYKWEEWDFHEALYFTFISILTVGFGDFVPKKPNHLLFSLFYVILGVVFATTVIDTVGNHYLQQIHTIGRRIKETDLKSTMRRWKYNRRKKQMALLWIQFAKSFAFGLALPSPDTEDLIEAGEQPPVGKKRKKRRLDRRNTCFDRSLLGRFPPDPPQDCQVLSTSAYSVRLAWSPAFSRTADVCYNICYKLKSASFRSAQTVRDIVGLEYEVKGLQSCSLYEFYLTAANFHGSSRPIHFVQFTEPETSPQNITLEMLNPSTAYLQWDPPFKKRRKLLMYLIYFTDESHLEFSQWNKLPTTDHSAMFQNLEENKVYLFCLCSVFVDKTKSPLSRSLIANTELSNRPFNEAFIGHSKTLATMENLTNEHISRVLPKSYLSYQQLN